MSRHLAVLSLGGGAQSATLAETACDGDIGPLQVIAFADTGGEVPETYEHVDYLRGRADQAGIHFLTVTAGNLSRDLVAPRPRRTIQPARPDQTRRRPTRPANHYRCSYDYQRHFTTRTVKPTLRAVPGLQGQPTEETNIARSGTTR